MRLRGMWGSILAATAAAALVTAIVWGAVTTARGPLDGRWELTALVLDGESVEVTPLSGASGSSALPRLRLDRGSFTATACNSADGGFRLDGDSFALTDYGVTALGCEEAALDEAWFVALGLVDTAVAADDGRLLLMGPGARVLLVRAE